MIQRHVRQVQGALTVQACHRVPHALGEMLISPSPQICTCEAMSNTHVTRGSLARRHGSFEQRLCHTVLHIYHMHMPYDSMLVASTPLKADRTRKTCRPNSFRTPAVRSSAQHPVLSTTFHSCSAWQRPTKHRARRHSRCAAGQVIHSFAVEVCPYISTDEDVPQVHDIVLSASVHRQSAAIVSVTCGTAKCC